jgi:hypothetical protein
VGVGNEKRRKGEERKGEFLLRCIVGWGGSVEDEWEGPSR